MREVENTNKKIKFPKLHDGIGNATLYMTSEYFIFGFNGHSDIFSTHNTKVFEASPITTCDSPMHRGAYVLPFNYLSRLGFQPYR